MGTAAAHHFKLITTNSNADAVDVGAAKEGRDAPRDLSV